jgi:hypothetical protein
MTLIKHISITSMFSDSANLLVLVDEFGLIFGFWGFWGSSINFEAILKLKMKGKETQHQNPNKKIKIQ